MTSDITIDGGAGEGGGQILRTALGLSLVTGRPFRIVGIRAGRRAPGLLRQHVTAVHAATGISGARVTGGDIGSRTLTFEPQAVRGGVHHLAIGSAGSTTLVLQTVLPALLLADGPSRLTLEGGTHNPFAPPFEFLAQAFLPILRRMGASIEIRLDTHGFYPAGGGRVTLDVTPVRALQPMSLLDRGPVRLQAWATVAGLPPTIGQRELAVVRERMGIDRDSCRTEVVTSPGPGNVLMIGIVGDSVTEIVTGFGVKGVSAETVASDACDEAQAHLAADVPVGAHLADQLLVPMALAGGGAFRSVAPTPHTRTNADVIRQFLDVSIAIEAEPRGTSRIDIQPAVKREAS